MRFEKTLTLAIPVEPLWDLMAHTDRLNREVGLPPVEFRFEPRAAGGTKVTAQVQIAGFKLQYAEHPFEWVKPSFYRVRRTFHGGPIRRFYGGTDFLPAGETTNVRVWAELEPASLAGIFACRAIGSKSLADLVVVCRRFETFLKGQCNSAYPRHAPRSPVDSARLNRCIGQLKQSGVDSRLADRLSDFLALSSPDETASIRPFALADRWKMDRMEVLTAFLLATRVGLLDLRWRVLCPYCRGGHGFTQLQDLNAEAHCHACNIRFDSTFDRNVEVFFRIAPAIRPALNTVYCIGGPALSPHVSAQFVLPPGSRTEQKISLPPGEYSLSSLQSTDPFLITVSETGAASLQVSLQKRDNNVLSVYSDEDQAASHADWVLVNETEEEIVLRVEDRKWVSDAVTAAMVTSLAEFRSQFSSQVLSPDTEIAVEQVCILFSDLKNSTAMYRAEGDAPSYHRVREHFVMMRQIITENNGAVIKTIGDAVMASFSDPADGLSAALAIQRESASREDGLIIKIGLHWGPALTVNANNTLDYFGQTVNLASRLQKESKGGDVALSALLADDPRVQEFLKSGACAMERFTTQVRGVEDSVKMLRLTPRG